MYAKLRMAFISLALPRVLATPKELGPSRINLAPDLIKNLALDLSLNSVTKSSLNLGPGTGPDSPCNFAPSLFPNDLVPNLALGWPSFAFTHSLSSPKLGPK